MPKYRLKLGRFRLQTTIVEIDAPNSDAATAKAIARASHLPTSRWHDEVDPKFHSPHVQDYFGPDSDTDDEEVDFSRADDELGENVRYLVLKADVGTGEGSIILAPWLKHESDLTIADLCMDWIAQLERLRADGWTSFVKWLKEQFL